jgi:hypothetical protein
MEEIDFEAFKSDTNKNKWDSLFIYLFRDLSSWRWTSVVLKKRIEN